MEAKVIVIGLAVLAFLLVVATIAAYKKGARELVYIFGLAALAVLAGVIGGGIVVLLFWAWLIGSIAFTILMLSLISISLQKRYRKRRSH